MEPSQSDPVRALSAPPPRREITFIREAEEGEDVCCICLHRFANTVLEPCMHQDFCNYCAHQVIENTETCPLCRAGIKDWKPLYPVALRLSEEERNLAADMTLASYDELELQKEYADFFAIPIEEALAYAATARENVAAWRRGQ
jgi:hypothetical protein